MSNNQNSPQNTEFLNRFLDYLNRRDQEEENPHQIIEVATIDEPVDEIESKAVLSFSDLALDLDKFEGFSDDKIVEHLQRVGKLATDGQLKEVIGMHPTFPYQGSHDDLVLLYIDYTMKVVEKLRSLQE
jgi:hypothetical protein